MATDFLSQDEVDALLKGVSGETDEPEVAEEGGAGVHNYNLGTQERIVRGRMPTLELINERFARYLRIGLFNYMHRTTDISVGPIRVQKYSEFIRNLVVPTNLNLVAAKPLRGTSLFVLDPNLVFSSSTTCSAATGASTPASKAETSHRPNNVSSKGCSTSFSLSIPARGNRFMT
jgi:flagellar motor switch protein FliM